MNPFLERLSEQFPPTRWEGMTILVACSGGADSVALLRGLNELRPAKSSLLVGHFNHRLRGRESDEDQAFVKRLAGQFGLPLITNDLVSVVPEAPQESSKVRDEASLREARYSFLHDACCTHGARYLLTAHTANDQAETVLFRLFRGTGLAGLAGMQTFREFYPGADLVLARPMLGISRVQVLEYLSQLGQDFRHDSSNDSLQYTRNWMRHQLVPILQERMGEEAIDSVLRASESIREIVEWIDNMARHWILEHVEITAAQVRIDRASAEQTDWPVLQAALKQIWLKQNWPLGEMNQPHWSRIRGFIDAQTPLEAVLDTQLPGGIQFAVSPSSYLIRVR